jgi:hypothetical protein
MSDNITSEEVVDLSSFGVGRKKPVRKKEDLSNGKAMVYLIPPVKKGGSRNILFSPKAAELLGLDTESKESVLAFNFGNTQPFVCNLTGQNIGQLPKNAALKVYHEHKDYMGSYTKDRKTFEKLGGQEEGEIVAMEVSEFQFAYPSISVDTSTAGSLESHNVSTDSYNIEPAKEAKTVASSVASYS